MTYNPNTPVLSTTQRNCRRLIYEGYSYVIDRNSWRCDMRDIKCKGRLRQNGDVYVDTMQYPADAAYPHGHSHASDHERVQGEMAKSFIYQQVTTTTDPARSIVADGVATASAGVVANMPTLKSFSRSISRKRKINDLSYPIPRRLADINIPVELTTTKKGDNFIWHDSGPNDPERIIVFATDANIAALNQCEIIMADGTFKVAPDIFYQLWVVHGLYRNRVQPFIYALLPRKTTEIYSRVLELIREHINPRTIIIDFEQAEEHAFRESFPDADMHGCFYHFAQSIYRKIQALGWTEQYTANENFAKEIRRFIALSFIHPNDVINVYNLLKQLFIANHGEEYGRVSKDIFYY